MIFSLHAIMYMYYSIKFIKIDQLTIVVGVSHEPDITNQFNLLCSEILKLCIQYDTNDNAQFWVATPANRTHRLVWYIFSMSTSMTDSHLNPTAIWIYSDVHSQFQYQPSTLISTHQIWISRQHGSETKWYIL